MLFASQPPRKNGALFKCKGLAQILRKNKYVPELLAFQKLGAVFASRALCFAAEKGQRFPMHWLFRAL